MKTLFRITIAALIVATAAGCDAFKTLNNSKKSAQGKPYELIVVCPQAEWTGEVGDSLRAIFTAPVPYLNQIEPIFDVLRVTERGFTGMIVMTLQGPSDGALVKYLSENRENLVYALEKAERDRAVKANETYGNPGIESAILKTFGVEMKVPKGYTLAAQKPDFIWARNEYPTASQGFFIYSYPYEGKQSLTEEALVAARNKYAAQIPGPSEGSYMITSDAFAPDYRLFRMEGRLWCELRGFWDVHGDFMGGPFVSYTTVDTATNRVFTLDCYVYAPDLNKPRKRNYMRGLEHLLYSVRFPRQ